MVIPAGIRRRLGLEPGTALELVVEGFSLRLVRAVAGPAVGRRGKRLVASPQAPKDERIEVDVASLVEEERARWPL